LSRDYLPSLQRATQRMKSIAAPLLAWFDAHGRHDLPWQHPRSPYRVWISEVMLQQTQVTTVIPYFERFVATLPDLPTLASAPLDTVLALWSGLGYYSRARNLHCAARLCLEEHAGELPADLESLAALPGIGRSTAGAILALAHGRRVPILDGNVKRVLTRLHAVRGWPGQASIAKTLWEFADRHTPEIRAADYTQAIMDLGATVCTRHNPRCETCPLRIGCAARRLGLVAQLPERKPGRVLPTRETCLLVVRDRDGRILLERRPPAGVWARLWSLPEVATPQAAAAPLRTLGLVHAPTALAPIAHGFSHYHLHIQPLLADVHGAGGIADSADRRWCTRADLATLGLPAPVRRLLDSLPEKPR